VSAENLTVHIDVFVSVAGKVFPLGHGDVEATDNPKDQGGRVADLLHKIAWDMEEFSQTKALDGETQGDLRETPHRKVVLPAGDVFFEVAPDEFVLGADYEGAVSSYKTFGGATTLQHLKRVFPGLRIEG
jgi:hypothetical protein